MPETAQQERRSTPAFSLRGVGRVYPGVTALDGVDLDGHPGEVLAICGANGAGKSTLARLLAGQERPSSGTVTITGYDGPITSPSQAEAAGVLLMHQEPLVIENFTVEENVWLSSVSTSGGTRPWSLVPRRRREATRAALDAVGMHGVDPRQPAGPLGPGPRQMLALSRTQVNPHRILLLDETTASTTEDHFRDVLALVDQERAAGVCVIFVSHRMDEVFAMSDRIAVLRGGRLVDVVRTAETTPGAVVDLMIGAAVAAMEPLEPAPREGEPPVLEVEGLSSGSARDISLQVRPGEVVGLYGLVGSGRSSIARSLCGHQDRRSGTVRLRGQEVSPTSPRAALELGIAYVTEDRRREGFVPAFTNGENATLSTLEQSSRLGVVDRAAERSRVVRLIEDYTVKGGPDTLTRTLSGGNQQKVVLAKWLTADPDFVALDEPTKGIDVGARSTIYEIIRALAAQGRAVLVVSSEAEEVLTLCSRVLVLRDGELVDELSPTTSTTDDLIRAALGGPAARPRTRAPRGAHR